MEITERQLKILNWIVQDYVELAHPISSLFIEKKHKTPFSSATIRIEFENLTRYGLVKQAYTSGGRMPTDLGYRFFVNELSKKMNGVLKRSAKKKWYKRRVNELGGLQAFLKEMSMETKNLLLCFLKHMKIVLKEGWEDVMQEPEFQDRNASISFFDFLKEFEENLSRYSQNKDEILIFIGKENPLRAGQDFSVILWDCSSRLDNLCFAILGPKRMDYKRNLRILHKIKEVFENEQ